MAGQLTIDTLKASSGVLATQNGMTGIAKAWANFSTTGTVNSSFNISSITKNATGDVTITFLTAMADTNYAIVAGSPSFTSSSCSVMGPNLKTSSPSGTISLKTTTQVSMLTGGVVNNYSTSDIVQASIAIFGA